MAYQRRTRLTVGDRVKGCQAVLFGQGPNGFLAAKDAAIKPKDLEGKDRETGAKFVVKDTFSVRIPKIQYFVYCITVYLSRQVFRRDFPKKSLIRE